MKTTLRMIGSALCLLTLIPALTARADSPCFDYTDLSSAKCETTSFDDQERLRSWNVNTVDQGPQSEKSRQTVHTDPLELDARTAYQLRTTLPDGRPAVRLGNWDINKQAERITYTYTVPEENPVLILYYAVVLEDPGHEEEAQPRFTMELLQNGLPAQSECFSFDFRAGFEMDSASWHLEMPGICWKDWTMMGVSLAEFAGKTVQLQFTTYDCSKGEHYGYAYFGIECRSNKMETTSCGDYTDSDAATFIAPDGFNYRWYLPAEPETTLSTERTFHHTGTSVTYYCDIINTENENCFFTLEATPEARYPIAEFTYNQIHGECADTLVVSNLSGVSLNGLDKNDPLEPCDNYLWDLGDGRTSTDVEPRIVYSSPGTYTISLIAGLNEWQCASAEYTATVTISPRPEAGRREVVLCEGEPMLWHGQVYTETGEYADPQGNGLCDSILALTVQPIGKSIVYDTICHGDAYSWRGATLTQAGVYTDTAYNKTLSGCDSVYYLNLSYYTRYDRVPQELQDRMTGISARKRVTYYSSNADPWDDPYMLVHIDHVTVNATSYEWHGNTYTASGVYADTLPTVLHGCDSIVFLDLQLTAVPTMTIVPQADSFCRGTTYTWTGRGDRFAALTQGGEYRDTVIQPVTLDTTLYILTLTQLLPSTWEESLTLCDTLTPYMWNGLACSASNDYVYTTTNVAGCDSVVTLHLTVITCEPPLPPEPPTVDTIKDGVTICKGLLPYTWEGHVFTSAGSFTKKLTNTAGEDSVVRFTVKVIENTTMAVDGKTIYSTDLPFTWEGHTFTTAGTFTQTLMSSLGCDSIVTFTLTVKDTVAPPPPPEPVVCTPLQLQLLPTDTICANDLTMPVALTIAAGQIARYDVRFSEAAHQQGYVDATNQTISSLADTLYIDLPQPADSTRYPRPDTYTMAIDITDTCGNVTQYPFSFTVLYPAWIIQQRWNDVLSVYNQYYNGGYTFTSIEWYYEGQPISGRGEHNSYIYIEPHLEYGDAYWLMLTRTDDGKTLPTCKCYPAHNPNARTEFKTPVRLIPRPNNRLAFQVQTNQSGTYQIIDPLGRVLGVGVYGEKYDSPDLVVPASFPAGTYIGLFRSEDDNSATAVKFNVGEM